MTSVIAWIAAHKRRPSGLYFASDSRRTIKLPNGEKVVHDNCIKVFALSGTTDIFAFAGDATFPPAAFAKICTTVRREAAKFNALSAHEKSHLVFQLLQTDFDALTTKPEYEFGILHGTRTGSNFNATFNLFQYSYSYESPYLTYGVMECGVGKSVALEMLGTGRTMVKSSVEKETKLSGDVSRAQFSAFCTAVQGKTANKDEWSGGPIQLVGVLSINDSVHMGVVTPDGTYFRGSAQLPPNPLDFYWRNTQFENVDAQGSPRKGKNPRTTI